MKAPSHLVLYDGDCAFCHGQVRLLRKLDWFHKLRFLPRLDPRVAEVAPGLVVNRLPQSICCVPGRRKLGGGGAVYCGARCIRFLAMRIPALFPLGLLLKLPGMIFPAEWVYRLIARNRRSLGRLVGCKSGCKSD